MFGAPAKEVLEQFMLPSKFEALQELKAQVDTLDVPEPIVVCIGAENAGKSSTFERLIQSAVFPRNSDVCTRAPMLVHLRKSDDVDAQPSATMSFRGQTISDITIDKVLKQAEDWMGGVTGICDDEMKLLIKCPDGPVMDIIDLPGLVSYPPELAQRSLELSIRYAKQPTAVVLAILEASPASVRSAKVFEAVHAAGATERTIVVFTKADLTQGSARRKLKTRLHPNPDVVQDDFVPLRLGYVALSNRDTEELQQNLKQQRLKEAKFFKREGFVGEGVCVGLAELEAKIRGSIDELLSGPWRSAFNRTISSNIADLEQSIERLGKYPVNLTEVVSPLAAAMPPAHDEFWTNLEGFAIDVTMVGFLNRHSGVTHVCNNFTQRADAEEKLLALIMDTLEGMLSCIKAAFEQKLKDFFKQDVLPLRLQRFSTLNEAMFGHDGLLELFFEDSRKKLYDTLAENPGTLITQGLPPNMPDLARDGAKALVAKKMLAPFRRFFGDATNMENVLNSNGVQGLMAENEEHHMERSRLNGLVQQHRLAAERVEELCGPAACRPRLN